MRPLNVIGAFTVLICNLVVSYNHSIQLFHSGGFHGWMAHVAVIGSECTFVMGALNLVVSRLKGQSPGVPAILGGLLGVTLVSWSNVAAGWEYGMTGVLLGLATPASLVVAEAILSRAILQRAASRSPGVETLAQESPTPAKVKMESPAPTDVESPAKVESPAPAPTPGELESPTPTSSNVESPAPDPAKVETPVMEEPPAPGNAEAPAKESPTPASKAEVEVEAPAPANVESTTKDEDPEEEIARAKEIALRFKKENGRLPGRRKLAELAGCGEWYARKALDELRKTA